MSAKVSEKQQKISKFGETGSSIKEFLRECRVEFGKISWPQRKELVESTWVVLATIFIISLFVLVCDQVLAAVLNFIMK